MRALHLLVAAVLATSVAAPTAVEAQRPGAAAKERRRERAKARIRVMRAMVLAEQLELDEATASKLAPVLNRFDDELDTLLQERRRLRAAIRRAADAGGDADLSSLLDALVANQDKRWALERARFTELRRVLTARQAARLVDVLPELDERILRALRERRDPAP